MAQMIMDLELFVMRGVPFEILTAKVTNEALHTTSQRRPRDHDASHFRLDESMSDDIPNRRAKLEKARREHQRAVMADYDVVHYAQMKALHQECGQSSQGHNWQFQNVGPVGGVWFFCPRCGATKYESDA